MIDPNFRTISTQLLVVTCVLAFVAGCGTSGSATLPPQAYNDNVVAVYGDEVLTVDEFETRYAQSTGGLESARTDSLESYRDFLERYVDFRLKVRAATDAGVPESPKVREEISTYRTNLARPYLLEQEVTEPLVRELYDRQQEMVDVSHILVAIDPGAAPEDTLAAYQKIQALRDSVMQGADFGEIALRNSEDPSARRHPTAAGYKGRIGFFSAGRVVEPFETYAYETAVGDVSPVFRTRFGYHILKVHDRTEAIPDRRLSHIMIRPGQAPHADTAAALAAIRDLQAQVEAGVDFAELAREHSQDLQSRARGGDLGAVSFDAPIHASFKEPAFALEEVGDVSDIVETPYGFHLIKLTNREERKSLEDSYEELKEQASQLPRAKEAERHLARRIIADRGAYVDTAAVLNALGDLHADSVLTRLVGKELPPHILADTVFSIGNTSYTVADMADATTRVTLDRAGLAQNRAMSILTAFVTSKAIDYEATRLEERDDEFRRLMAEFRDGLVLFQFMEDSVWTAAERDTAALRNYYEERADEYWWPERTRIVSIHSPSDSLLEVAAMRVTSGQTMGDVYALLVSDTLNTLRMDTTMVADSTHAIYDRALGLAPNEYVGPLPHRGSHVLLFNEGVEAPRRKTFAEARSQVVSEYQEILESRLLERLRRRYNAHTFPQRLVNAYSRDGSPDEITSGG